MSFSLVKRPNSTDFCCNFGQFSDKMAAKPYTAMRQPKFPMLIKRGSVIVKIYADRKPAGTYYRVAYYLGGKRCRLTFSNAEDAITEAEAQASKLSRGELDAMQITSKDRLIYGRALEAVRETGVEL